MTVPESAFDEASEVIMKYSDAFSEENDLDPNELKQKAKDILQEVGYSERLSGGTYIRVYANDNMVVKIALGRLGVKENAAEIRNNTRISKLTIRDVIDEGECSGDKYIADIPTYNIGSNRWLVMERVEVTPDNVSQETANNIQQAFKSEGVNINEISPYNMGVKNGLPIIFDYAGT